MKEKYIYALICFGLAAVTFAALQLGLFEKVSEEVYKCTADEIWNQIC